MEIFKDIPEFNINLNIVPKGYINTLCLKCIYFMRIFSNSGEFRDQMYYGFSDILKKYSPDKNRKNSGIINILDGFLSLRL